MIYSKLKKKLSFKD